jgi:hypothetical protein
MCSRSDLLNGVYAEVFCKTTVTGVDSSTLRREDCSPHAMGDDPLGEASIPAYLWNQAGVGRGSGGVDLAREGGPGHAISPPVSPPSIVHPTMQRTGGPVQAPAKRVERPIRVPELFEEDYSSMSDDEGGAIGDMNGIPHLYRDETWDKRSFEYDPPRRAFTGCGGPTFEAHHRMPTFLMLFRLFWPDAVLRKICTETNRYATTIDGEGNAPRGRRWRRLSVAGLKAFFAISMLIGLKRQPNMKTYWEQEGGFFHCPIISHIFTRDRFQQITKCLYITHPNSYVATRGEPGYDKMGQVRWLVDDIRRACM